MLFFVLSRITWVAALEVSMARLLSRTIFTLFQICWAFVWAGKHVKVRHERQYTNNRAQADTNSRYRIISYFLFVAQNILCVASFWSRSTFLLEIHDSKSLRVSGVVLIILATVLYFASLRYLGRNYSPCFDAHLPFELVSIGPYRFIRHPMYLTKLIIVIGNFVLSGSLWFVPMFLYLLFETRRTIMSEEKYLARSIFGYADYQRRTMRMVPLLF
jgi:protein-S-isoprenylcysteine O-methyltransferase Ste14